MKKSLCKQGRRKCGDRNRFLMVFERCLNVNNVKVFLAITLRDIFGGDL